MVLHLGGDLDSAAVPMLEAAVRSCARVECSSVTLDLSEINFISVSGLRSLALQRADLAVGGIDLRVEAASSAAARLLRIVDPRRRVMSERIPTAPHNRSGSPTAAGRESA